MPQFDIILYINFFINFIIYGFVLYLLIIIFVIPFFFNIMNKRFIKKEINLFFMYLHKIYYKVLKSENLIQLKENANIFSNKTPKFNLTIFFKLLKLKYILKFDNKYKF